MKVRGICLYFTVPTPPGPRCSLRPSPQVELGWGHLPILQRHKVRLGNSTRSLALSPLHTQPAMDGPTRNRCWDRTHWGHGLTRTWRTRGALLLGLRAHFPGICVLWIQMGRSVPFPGSWWAALPVFSRPGSPPLPTRCVRTTHLPGV